MFNKTIRSVLSLALVFCLLLGMSGNAIALAVGSPATDAIDKVDKEVNQIIADLESKIAELEEEVAKQEKKLADAEEKLDEGKDRLPDDKALLADKREQLNDAKTKLADAKIQLEAAQNTLQNYQDQVDELLTKIAVLEEDLKALEGLPGYDEKLAELNDKEAELVTKKAELAAKEKEVKDAIRYIGELEDFVEQCDEKIKDYEENVIPQIEKDIDEAEKALPDAKNALKEANEALAAATVAVENLKTTYETLYDAVTDPTLSLEFVRETVSDLNDQRNTLWDSVLDLQTALDELEDAYEALKDFNIDPMEIEKFKFDGFKVETVTIEGETFGGQEVGAFEVEGFSFGGFAAPTIDELSEISDKLDNVIAKAITLNEALSTFVATAKPYIAKALKVAEETLGITYEVLKNNLNKEGVKKVYDWLCDNPAKVCALVEKFGVYGLDKVINYGPYALDLLNNHFDLVVLAMKVTAGGVYLTYTLGAKVLGYLGDRIDFLKDYKDKVVEAARKLYAKYGDEAKALLKVYVDYLDLEERYFNATHADLELYCNNINYVAIGDFTVSNAGSYADKLAEKLAEELNVTYNKQAGELTVDDAVKLIAGNKFVENADLITVSFGNLPAINNMIGKLTGLGHYEPDWSLISNDTVHELITKALAELETELVDYGFNAATTAKVLAAAEAFAHTFALQQLSYIDLINEIQAVNPDAQIVIVSAYNELETVTLVGGTHQINAGKLIQPLVDIVNLQALAEGFLNENVIYVHATDVELETTNEVVNISSETALLGLLVLMTSPNGLVPTGESYEYIAEEILAALTVTNHGHDMGEWYVSIKPTVDAEGEERRDCLHGCGYFETRPLEKLQPDHEHVAGEIVKENEVAADCVNPGSCDLVVYCAVCGEELFRQFDVIPALGHTPGDIVIENVVGADCYNIGSYDEVVYCTVCGEELSRETVADDYYHADISTEVEFVKPTCTEGGYYRYRVYCTICDYTIDERTVPVRPTGHTEGDVVIENEVAAGCVTPDSYDLVVYCTVCGEELSRESVVGSALGHTYGEIVFENETAATCTAPGSVDAVVYCAVCGEELSRETYFLDATGHVLGEWELHKLPTFSEDGELRRYCLNCDYYESYVLPALNKPDCDLDFDFRCELLDKLRELYDLLGDKIFDMVEDATHADYTIFHDSLYVAIGDGSAASYPEKLAELMEIPHLLENLAESGMTVEDAIELVGKQGDLISKADLITLGFSNIAASIDMMEALAGQYTADWSEVIGETAANAIEKALVELKDRLDAEGLDTDTVKMVLGAANAYAYAYTARCLQYPNLVEAVREVNSDALIVIVGTYNDMEDVKVTINGHEINIGEYTKYLIYAANLENLLQAICGEDVIYVHAPEVETVYEENNYGETNVLGYLMSLLNDEMMPSEAGSAYIAQQIRDALNVEYAIWGDVNGDRRVDCRDARLILRYAAQLISEDDLDLTWADVNGDGKVNARDARLILRVRAQLIEHFPVCRLSEE